MNTQELIDVLNEQWKKKIEDIIRLIKAEINEKDEYMLDENGRYVYAISTNKVIEIIDKCIPNIKPKEIRDKK